MLLAVTLLSTGLFIAVTVCPIHLSMLLFSLRSTLQLLLSEYVGERVLKKCLVLLHQHTHT